MQLPKTTQGLDYLLADQDYVNRMLKQYLGLADGLQDLDKLIGLQQDLMPNLDFKPNLK
jgi:hypothetical protein